MFLIKCPHCQEVREEEEFSYSGEAFVARPLAPESLSEDEWGDYLFMKRNIKGWNWEMWNHSTGCRKFFVAKRNTANHQMQGSWTLAEARVAYDAEQAAV